MLDIRTQHIVNDEGKVTAVVLEVADWQRVVAALERLEDLDDVHAYDAAKAVLADDELIPGNKRRLSLKWRGQQESMRRASVPTCYSSTRATCSRCLAQRRPAPRRCSY